MSLLHHPLPLTSSLNLSLPLYYSDSSSSSSSLQPHSPMTYSPSPSSSTLPSSPPSYIPYAPPELPLIACLFTLTTLRLFWPLSPLSHLLGVTAAVVASAHVLFLMCPRYPHLSALRVPRMLSLCLLSLAMLLLALSHFTSMTFSWFPVGSFTTTTTITTPTSNNKRNNHNIYNSKYKRNNKKLLSHSYKHSSSYPLHPAYPSIPHQAARVAAWRVHNKILAAKAAKAAKAGKEAKAAKAAEEAAAAEAAAEAAAAAGKEIEDDQEEEETATRYKSHSSPSSTMKSIASTFHMTNLLSALSSAMDADKIDSEIGSNHGDAEVEALENALDETRTTTLSNSTANSTSTDIGIGDKNLFSSSWSSRGNNLTFIVTGMTGESCSAACARYHYVCSPVALPAVNSCRALLLRMPCQSCTPVSTRRSEQHPLMYALPAAVKQENELGSDSGSQNLSCFVLGALPIEAGLHCHVSVSSVKRLCPCIA